MLAQSKTPAAHVGEDQPSPTAAPAQCWSVTSEDFEEESLSNLIIANDWLRAGDIVYVGEKKTIRLGDLVDANDVLLIMTQRSTAFAGAAADGYPGVGETQKNILNAALRGWIALCCPPEFLGVEKIRRHTLTDADLDAAARMAIAVADAIERDTRTVDLFEAGGVA